MLRIITLVLGFVMLATANLQACGDYLDRDQLIDLALADVEGTKPWVVAALRRGGAAGLAEVLSRYDAAVAAGKVDQARWDALIAGVAGQHLARHSRLYWYTDLEQAKAAATASGKPIVSLRLLGKLTDELSCANSRFFRVVLYSDPTVSAWLREHVVLHWSSERPVPVVTIDFGDGRTIRTTVTGNSAHYLLDADGRPLDVIPGLYGPQAFLTALQRVEELHRLLNSESRIPRSEALTAWHRQQITAILAQRRKADLPDMQEIAAERTVRQAEAITASKKLAELPLLTVTDLIVKSSSPEDVPEPRDWTDIAKAACIPTERLSTKSRHLAMEQMESMRETPRDILRHVDRFAVSVQRKLAAFERTLLADTARNSLELHLRIHRQLAEHPDQAWDVLNRWLYATVFLTPAEDRWLGLDPGAVYSALNFDVRN